jgi:hypothetical protein
MPSFPLFCPGSQDLTLYGYHALQQAALTYCEANRYPPWRIERNASTEQCEAWLNGFSTALVEFHQANLYVQFFAASWGDSASAFLSQEEVSANFGRQRTPDRDLVKPGQDYPEWSHTQVPPISLNDLLARRAAVDALLDRLEPINVAPYSASEMPAAEDASQYSLIWAAPSEGRGLVALQLRSVGDQELLVLPDAWSGSPDLLGILGNIEFDPSEALCVFDGEGRAGFLRLLPQESEANARPSGRVAAWTPRRDSRPRYRYVSDSDLRAGYYDAAETLRRNAHGDWVCDLIDADGRIINPPGTKVLLGHELGGRVLTLADDHLPRRVDWWSFPKAGESSTPMPPLRWQAVWPSYPLCIVKAPDSDLQGWINRQGEIVIPPIFANAQHFYHGLAHASPAEHPDKTGLLDLQGRWVIPPVWLSIDPQNEHFIVVQDAADCWGAIRPVPGQIGQTELVVDLVPAASWLAEAAADGHEVGEAFERSKLIAVMVTLRWHAHVRERVAQAKTETSLASLEGLFGNWTTTSELYKSGITSISVEVLNEHTNTLLKPRQGDRGYIGVSYPVSLNCFALQIEAPVMGLPCNPNACLGVPWRDLRALPADTTPPSGPQNSPAPVTPDTVEPHQNSKSSQAGPLASCLLGAIWLLVFSIEILASCSGTEALIHVIYGWNIPVRILSWLGVGTILIAVVTWLAVLARRDSATEVPFARIKRFTTRLFILAVLMSLLLLLGATRGSDWLFKPLAAIWIAFLYCALVWINLETGRILVGRKSSQLCNLARDYLKAIRQHVAFSHQNEYLLTEIQDELRMPLSRVCIERIACTGRDLELSMSIQTASRPWKNTKLLTLRSLSLGFVAFSRNSLEYQNPTWPGDVYSDVSQIELPFKPCRLHGIALNDRASSPTLDIVLGDEDAHTLHNAPISYSRRSKRWNAVVLLAQGASR